MVKKMNKTEFLDKLAKELSYSLERCSIINEILENNFFISKKIRIKLLKS